MYEIDLQGIGDVKRFLQASPLAVARASRDAVTAGLRFGYTLSSRAIRRQVNLPASYLGSAQAGNRLRITRRPTEGSPVGVISARQRPVSLARYAKDRSLGRRRGVTVSVKPGSSTKLSTAFLARLRRGRQLTEDAYNIGLVVRMKPGQSINTRTRVRYSSKDPNLFLLYSPSVDQVFRNTRDEVAPAIGQYLASEWLRQYERYVRG